jgi:hypothetical protein
VAAPAPLAALYAHGINVLPGAAVDEPVFWMLATSFSATTFGEDMASLLPRAADAG